MSDGPPSRPRAAAEVGRQGGGALRVPGEEVLRGNHLSRTTCLTQDFLQK